jgi:hypothetical protein
MIMVVPIQATNDKIAARMENHRKSERRMVVALIAIGRPYESN